MSGTLAAGEIFGGYRIESLVGRGGMGVVYRATDVSLERPVALKLIAPELAEDARFRSRFLKESRLAASLDHANVVPIYEAGEHGTQLYLAMRYVEGSDLRTVLRRDGKLGLERALSILGQVAGALDAAHRRDLVHRDVKPANMLIDDEGHAYLTDFGVTKQVGGDSTEPDRIVGTLDYLAPEQIRGEAVDARSDCYALGCVLQQCLAGSPPFRRETEAETLWAHMREDPAPIPEHPELTPVLGRALAKDKHERYDTCGQLIHEARQAVGLAAPPVRRRRIVPRPLLSHRGILAAGVLVLSGAAVAATVALTDDEEPPPPPVSNGIAAIDVHADRIGSFTKAVTAPSNIAVGDNAVWVLSAEDKTISRLDPATKRIVQTIRTSGHAVDVAVGAGAVWVGNGGTEAGAAKISVSRIDPRTRRITRTTRLPHTPDRGGWQLTGHPGTAVGAGGVWTGNREGTISRLDPATGRLVATVDTFARRIAAGPEGVWVVGQDNTITGIDPRTNRVRQTIHVGTNNLSGIAVGTGSIWATSEEGLLWRIEPGERPIARSIDVGSGTEYVAFGDGFVWTANYVDGSVSRVDPATNRVTGKVPVGAAQALAAGEGSAWVSVAEGARAGELPRSTCDEVSSGGAEPDVLIASDLPLQGPEAADPRAMADAIRLVLRDHGFRAGRFVVGYQSCDDSTAQQGYFELRKCAANANAYAKADRLVAVIGPFNSPCAQVEVPILNRAPDGPLGIVSPSNTYPNLTRGGRLALPPPEGRRGEPDVYYPTGERNFMRLAARDDRQGVAHAMLARDLGLDRVFLTYSAFAGGDVVWTGPFQRAAARLGVGIAGVQEYDRIGPERFAAIARRIARSGADGVLIGGDLYLGGAELLKALRARLGPSVTIMAGGFESIPDVLELAGRSARGLYVTSSEIPPDALDLTERGKSFTDEFGTAADASYTINAAQATEVVLQAIARSDGTRSSVLRELWRTDVNDGILGSFRFDRFGDIVPPRIVILRITGSSPPGFGLPEHFKGAVVDRVKTIPDSLAK